MVSYDSWLAMTMEVLCSLSRWTPKTFEFLLPIAFLGIVVALINAADIEDDDIYSSVRSSGFHEGMASKYCSFECSNQIGLRKKLGSHTAFLQSLWQF
jgi:hypothetical protein